MVTIKLFWCVIFKMKYEIFYCGLLMNPTEWRIQNHALAQIPPWSSLIRQSLLNHPSILLYVDTLALTIEVHSVFPIFISQKSCNGFSNLIIVVKLTCKHTSVDTCTKQSLKICSCKWMILWPVSSPRSFGKHLILRQHSLPRCVWCLCASLSGHVCVCVVWLRSRHDWYSHLSSPAEHTHFTGSSGKRGLFKAMLFSVRVIIALGWIKIQWIMI